MESSKQTHRTEKKTWIPMKEGWFESGIEYKLLY